MEPLSLLSPNTDNFFKFLFLNGLVMIAIGLFYPLQKSNEIQIRILDYNKKVELLEQDIIKLKNDLRVLNTIVDNRIKLSESLVNQRKYLKSQSEIIIINNKISETKLKTNLEYQEKLKNKDNIGKNKIILNAEKRVIQQLKKQASVYDSYCYWLFNVGLFLGIGGFIGWIITTFFSEFPNYISFKDCWNTEMRKRRRLRNIRRASRIDSTTIPAEQSTNSDNP
jgi:hypothetical protein